MPGVHGRACSVGGLMVGIAEELLYISVWLVMTQQGRVMHGVVESVGQGVHLLVISDTDGRGGA